METKVITTKEFEVGMCVKGVRDAWNLAPFPYPMILRAKTEHYDPTRYVGWAFTQINGAVEEMFQYMPTTAKFEVIPADQIEGLYASALQGFIETPSIVKQAAHIGSDPELFVVDEFGVVIPAFKFLPSKKDHPRATRLPFWDGFQAEFRTAPFSCLEELSRCVCEGLSNLHRQAVAYNPLAKLSLKTVIDVPEAVLASSKREHVILGCDPSENIYGLHGMCVEYPEKLDIRFAGGHMHFGYDAKLLTPNMLEEIIKTLDAIVGVASISLFDGIENPLRRKFYGLPGEYRLPKHGLEYRTLGNGWLCAPGVMHLVWDLARAAFDMGRKKLRAAWECDEQEVIEVILAGDVKGARKILDRNKGLLKGLLANIYNYMHQVEAQKLGMQALMNGVEVVLTEPTNIEKNWNRFNMYDLEDFRWSTLAHKRNR